MATIVKLKHSNHHAILLGAGYGQYSSARPGAFFGDAFPVEKNGSSEMVAVSSADGKILWCESSELVVVSVDGQTPAQLLAPYFE